jgi:hypothetical protein
LGLPLDCSATALRVHESHACAVWYAHEMTSMICRPLRSICLLSLVLLGATACKTSDGTDDGDQPATPIEADEAAEVLAQQICAQMFTCECPNNDYVDEADCVASVSAELAAIIDPTLAAGGSWDAECAGNMAKAMRDWECLGPDLAAATSSFSPLICPILKGNVGLNGECGRSSLGDDCQPGLLCLNQTCIEEPTLPVPIGGVCGYDNLPCADGGYCEWDQNYNVRICHASPTAGDTCVDDNYPCGPASNDLICSDAGICEPAPGEGESCDGTFVCGPGLYCDGGQEFTCQPRRELGDGCGGDAVCPVDAACINSICEADPALVCNASSLF